MIYNKFVFISYFTKTQYVEMIETLIYDKMRVYEVHDLYICRSRDSKIAVESAGFINAIIQLYRRTFSNIANKNVWW
jgi:hypothetical protein